jgi:hypothetical protein
MLLSFVFFDKSLAVSLKILLNSGFAVGFALAKELIDSITMSVANCCLPSLVTYSLRVNLPSIATRSPFLRYCSIKVAFLSQALHWKKYELFLL